ncbi:MAG TPA: D-2-hydroxyacid dehydrogenase [Bryobacteraceae bacterium]|jgi:phosphoglycerate dehydrogenase-like enzyme|nr:D-2-hydroxyacid dehydrogenase [Bryobacteraceae bacterium]
MDKITLVVLGDPAEPVFRKLQALAPEVEIKIGRTAESLLPELADARVLFHWLGGKDQVRQVLSLAPRLEWIHARYAGLDNLLSPELIESPVPLSNGSGVFSQSLGEFVILGALYFAKDVPRLLRSKEAHRWEIFDVHELSRQTLGIVGHGDIGRAIAWRAKALGMRVLALRRNPAPRAGDEHVDRVYANGEIHAMLPECDYVVVAAPLTPHTKGMMGAREFASMKPDAIVMNVGRGPVINEAAMIEALRAKQIRGAALDVFEVEPLPPESPLWSMENVLISPHTADHTKTWIEDAMDFFLAQFASWRAGEPLQNIVDKRAGY